MFTGKTVKLSAEEKENVKGEFMRKRHRYEKKHLNGFELIHPLEDYGTNQQQDETLATMTKREYFLEGALSVQDEFLAGTQLKKRKNELNQMKEHYLNRQSSGKGP